ncbi:MAG TPA: iron chelate uptake ABC transporter family permease subunit [Candidatus Limnocylindria bacterium]|nr:iron chelate uptake ABC transporter family permease subunit [Candidatus Limnocylindria bacterium]
MAGTTQPVLGGIALLVLTGAVAATLGPARIPLDVQGLILASHLPFVHVVPTWPASYEAVLFDIRLPRVVLAALTGAALAVAGATYQGLFRNPLADPYLLGIASGAGLGAVLAFVLPFPALLYGIGIVQILAFVTALCTAGLVYWLARVGRITPLTTLLLAGIAIGAFASALTAYLMYANGEKLFVIYSWMLGGFNGATWQQVAVITPYVLVGGTIIALSGRVLNVLQLDEEQAASLGVNVERAKLGLVAAATLATAAAVSVSGLIGFVGLMVPHFVRLLFGPDHRRLVPLVALFGAAFLVAADAIARGLLGASEVPVGVVTAACGAPFFLHVLRRQKRNVF